MEESKGKKHQNKLDSLPKAWRIRPFSIWRPFIGLPTGPLFIRWCHLFPYLGNLLLPISIQYAFINGRRPFSHDLLETLVEERSLVGVVMGIDSRSMTCSTDEESAPVPLWRYVWYTPMHITDTNKSFHKNLYQISICSFTLKWAPCWAENAWF